MSTHHGPPVMVPRPAAPPAFQPAPSASHRFVERARKRFMNKQRDLLKEAQEAGARVRDGSASGSGSPINARAAAGEGAEDAAAKDACATALEALAGDTPRRFEQRFGTAASDAPPDASANNEKATTDLLTDLRTTMEETDQIQELMKKEQERVSQEEMNAKEEKSGFSFPDVKTLYSMFMALLPCLMYIAACFVLGLIENFHYDCYNTELFPDHDSWVASSNCWTLPVDAFYYSIITLTTIGYGDVTPHSMGGKVGTLPLQPQPLALLLSPPSPRSTVGMPTPDPCIAHMLTEAVRKMCTRSFSLRCSFRLPSSR